MNDDKDPLLSLPNEAESAKLAGLRYTRLGGPGIKRKRSGKSFRYIGPDNKPVRAMETLARIRALVLPPAWESVWINPLENGHIQAVGRDARGRLQYRYHAKYRAIRDSVKFERMFAFGRALPRLRRMVTRDLGSPGFTKKKVLAAIVRLLETTYIRIGNEEYADENKSFGLTTLRNRHVQILGSTVKFQFVGKSKQKHEIKVQDKRLAQIVRRCKEIPGNDLFEYLDEEGKPQGIESGDVNDYLRDVSGGDFTAKDFRTWGGTCLAASYLHRSCSEEPPQGQKKVLLAMIKDVALKLGNKPATCKKYYIHPGIVECFSAGDLKTLIEAAGGASRSIHYERIVLRILKPMKRKRSRAA
jgi:DNA topoisomerase I